MTNKEKYAKAFCEVFNVTEDQLDELKYQSIKEWDSVGHMAMTAALEDAFEIMLDMDDIIDFASYQKGFEILAKYGVEF